MNHYFFKTTPVICQACGWSGTGSEARSGEMFDEAYEYDCPKCDETIGSVPFPSLTDAREAWDILPEEERAR